MKRIPYASFGRKAGVVGGLLLAGWTASAQPVRDAAPAAEEGPAAPPAAPGRSGLRDRLLRDVGSAWVSPPSGRERTAEPPVSNRPSKTPLERKLDAIVIPSVTFAGTELPKAVATLGALAEEYDASGETPRGINLILADGPKPGPSLSLSLRGLSLRRVLELVATAGGQRVRITTDAVVIEPAGDRVELQTAVLPLAPAAVARMAPDGGGERAQPVPARGEAPELAHAAESRALRAFLQAAGVDFAGTPGSALVYDGTAAIITHTPAMLERAAGIAARYRTVRQVEIEAKFMEVEEGALDELGLSWSATRRPSAATGLPQERYQTANRSLAEAFSGAANSSSIVVDGEAVGSVAPPALPGVVPLANGAPALAQIEGSIGGIEVHAALRALAQRRGSDLLSAPRVTVLSGTPATITVAQELRYPQEFGQIESQVGTASTSGNGGSAGVTITAGKPQNFVTRNVGVELRVTPVVEEDGGSIALELSPRVTEFEGFVEYGGPSLAISSGRTVTIPSGFYQPIFSVREVSTRVAIRDGATLVLGGLVREEARQVDDKVPVLGNLPAVGRLFRSKGDAAAKRNLLIFVTARIVDGDGLSGGASIAGTSPAGGRSAAP